MLHLIAKPISAVATFATHKKGNIEPRWFFRNKDCFVTLDVLDILADGGTIKEAMTTLAVSDCYFHNGEMDEVPTYFEPSWFWRMFGYTKQDVIDFYEVEDEYSLFVEECHQG